MTQNDNGGPPAGPAVEKVAAATEQRVRCEGTAFLPQVDRFLEVVDPSRRDLLAAVLALDGVSLAVLLSVLPVDHELVAAARVGVVVADLRREQQAAMVAASHAVAGSMDWRRYVDERVTHDDLLRRRYPPVGDRGEWVRTGGAA